MGRRSTTIPNLWMLELSIQNTCISCMGRDGKGMAWPRWGAMFKYRKYAGWELKEPQRRKMISYADTGCVGSREVRQVGGRVSHPYPSFSLMLFSESFCSDASQRSGGGKSAACTRSLLQISLGCTQMDSEHRALTSTSTRKQNMQSQISGVHLWP